MILVGNQRGGAKELAVHLLKPENERVEVHEVRDFASEDLTEALMEAYAVSRGTKCKQYLYSLSLNPPAKEEVSVEVFEDAIERAEERLNLSGQPRAIVFHEKVGPTGEYRRHAHAVWSRIDTEEMKAIHLPYTKRQLMDLARELYIEHGWEMPKGLIDRDLRNPLNYSLAEYQQAKRAGHDAKELKAWFQKCWERSDSTKAFSSALRERGFYLSQGDRRGHVAVSYDGEVYAVSKWTGNRTKDVREKLGPHTDLPTMQKTKEQIAQDMAPKIKGYVEETKQKLNRVEEKFAKKRKSLIAAQQQEKQALTERQMQEEEKARKERDQRFNTGLAGLWDRVSGKHARIRRQNEEDATLARLRDRLQEHVLVDQQIGERNRLRRLKNEKRASTEKLRQELKKDQSYYRRLREKHKLVSRKDHAKDNQEQTNQPIRGPTLDHDR